MEMGHCRVNCNFNLPSTTATALVLLSLMFSDVTTYYQYDAHGSTANKYQSQQKDESRISVKGYPCLRDSCSNDLGFWRCVINDYREWDYCCRPDHPCGYYDGWQYQWCYVGSDNVTWVKCKPVDPDIEVFDSRDLSSTSPMTFNTSRNKSTPHNMLYKTPHLKITSPATPIVKNRTPKTNPETDSKNQLSTMRTTSNIPIQIPHVYATTAKSDFTTVPRGIPRS